MKSKKHIRKSIKDWLRHKLFKLTGYGKDTIVKVFAVTALLVLISLFINNNPVKYLIILLCVFIWLFTLYFFRDPERKLPGNYRPGMIISPGDGKVVIAETVVNNERDFFKDEEELFQISIFLSPLNVHVNRIPMSGTVTYLKYIKGDYIVAFDHKSSERNERSVIGIEDKSTGKKVLFKQIAGFVARRIVYEISEGNSVEAGERFGMIKFGSRVDILLKKDAKISVSLNQKTTGGETIIAEI